MAISDSDNAPVDERESEEPDAKDPATVDPEGVEDALDLLFSGRVEAVLPPEEISEFHDFIREEALRRRRFAVSFRLNCGCLAWIGYALSSVVTHEEGIEFKARAIQSYIPDHDADVEHPEGPTEDPPEEFAEWPIWPFEIYQDELEDSDPGMNFNEVVAEAADDLHLDLEDDLAEIKYRADHEGQLSMDD